MDKSRKIFENRRSTLKKKAGELAALCNVEVCMVCFGPDGDLQVWPENPTKVQSIISKYKEATKKGNKRRRKEKLELSDVMESQIKKLQKQVLEDETNWDSSDYGIGGLLGGLPVCDKELHALSKDSLMGLSDCLEAKIQSLNQKIESLKGKQTAPSIVQNQFEHNYVQFAGCPNPFL